MLAATFVRADMAAVLVGLAQQFGLALRRMSLSSGATAGGSTHATTMH